VLIATQLGYYGHWPALARLRLAFVWRVLVPVLSALFGYVPAGFGLAEDLPRGVAEQWARWCLHREYLVSEYPEARARFAHFDRPLVLFSFTDDAFAPEPAVHALLDLLPRAGVAHRRIEPAEHGDQPIGHFGFFRGRFADSLWREALAFMDSALEGQGPRGETTFSAA
jgi:predicted alpha/beta hydrolase